MASSTAPSTPDGAAPPILRRAFTVPTKLTKSNTFKNYSHTAEAAVVDTLFTHHGKIISFSPSSSNSRPRSSSGPQSVDSDRDSIGSLPWVSYTERTVAAGPLRFYRVPGMVAFLSSGSILRPILAKSQCWCVDGDTKFVLRISQNQYYRIELPNTSEEDKEKAEELKKVLAKVLQYETTPCPFQRSFTVQLPEPPKTPVRKRPWRPPARATQLEIETTTELELESADEYTTAASDNSSLSGTDDEVGTGDVDNEGITRRWAAGTDCVPTDSLKSPIRPKPLTNGRAITAPTQLIITETPPPGFESPLSATNNVPTESSSLSSRKESFHSFHSPISPLPPSPPYSDPPSPPFTLPGHIDLPRRRPHTRDISEITITADSPEFWDPVQTPTRSKNGHDPARLLGMPTNVDGTDGQNDEVWFEMMEPSAATELRYRSAPSRQRAHSPLPLAANLFSPTSRASGHHLTTAILQKTCSVLLGPPVHLIALMLNIAKKIASGATRGVAFGFGEAGERIPCQWDYSDTDEIGDGAWGEDDYGIALGNMPAKTTKRGPFGGSWEID